MQTSALGAAVTATIAIGGLLYAIFYHHINGTAAAQKRKAQFKANESASSINDRNLDNKKRRQQIAETLKQADSVRTRKKKVTLAELIEQSGLKIKKQTFYIFSVISALIFGLMAFTSSSGTLWSVALATVGGGIGFPRRVLKFLGNRRRKKFLNEFPAAVDVIIRGIKAGLPLAQTIGIVAAESPEPVSSEFRMIIESQAIGITIAEAIERLPQRIPLPECSFFSIVITLQQKSGGNLSEALGNLSKVLRDRKKMRLKVQAVSQEAKASAGIIASLPVAVGTLVYITTPDYISLLFTEPTGKMVLLCCAFWMSIGVSIMKKMINFDI